MTSYLWALPDKLEMEVMETLMHCGNPAGKLAVACYLGDVDMVKGLIAEGCRGDALRRGCQFQLKTASQSFLAWGPCAAIAAWPTGKECLQLLLNANLNPDCHVEAQSDYFIGTPVLYASRLGKVDALRILLEAGGGNWFPQQSAAIGNPMTALMVACGAGQAGAVKLLLEYGHDTNLLIKTGNGDGNDGDAALNLAIKKAAQPAIASKAEQIGAGECARMILAKHKAEDPDGFSSKHISDLLCYCSSDLGGLEDPLVMTQLLLDANVDPNAPAAQPGRQKKELTLMTMGGDRVDAKTMQTLQNINALYACTSPLEACVDSRSRYSSRDLAPHRLVLRTSRTRARI